MKTTEIRELSAAELDTKLADLKEDRLRAGRRCRAAGRRRGALQCGGFAHRTSTRRRPRRRARGCGPTLRFGHTGHAVCCFGNILPWFILHFQIGIRHGGLRGGRRLRPCQFFIAFFQFIADGAHRPDPRRACRHQAGQKRQRKAFAAQKSFDLLHFLRSHLSCCVRIASGVSVGCPAGFYTKHSLLFAFYKEKYRDAAHFLAFPAAVCYTVLRTEQKNSRCLLPLWRREG